MSAQLVIFDLDGTLTDSALGIVSSFRHALGEIGGLETLRAWREGAWRNAELLDSAKTPEERTSVMASIDASSEAWARMIVAPDFSSWWTVRYAHCKAFQSSLAQGKAG